MRLLTFTRGLASGAAHSLGEVDGARPVDILVGKAHPAAACATRHEPDGAQDSCRSNLSWVRKYERGDNRSSSSRVNEFALVLDMPVAFFFDEMAPEVGDGSPS